MFLFVCWCCLTPSVWQHWWLPSLNGSAGDLFARQALLQASHRGVPNTTAPFSTHACTYMVNYQAQQLLISSFGLYLSAQVYVCLFGRTALLFLTLQIHQLNSHTFIHLNITLFRHNEGKNRLCEINSWLVFLYKMKRKIGSFSRWLSTLGNLTCKYYRGKWI